MNILINNGTVLPMTEKGQFFKAAVGITGNRISMISCNEEQIEHFRNNTPDITEIDAGGMVVMPGLINSHTHVSMALMRGYSDDVELMDWLSNHIWPLEAKLTGDEVELGAELGIAEMLLGGTTSFIDMYHYESSVALAAYKKGIRAAVSPFFLDARMPLFIEDINKAVEFCKDKETLKVFVGPHAPYTCSDEAFRTGIEFAEKYDLGFHIHLNETCNETANYIEAHGESPVRHLEKMGLFSRPTVAAHCVYLDPEEMDILASHGVTAVNNPKSNMKLASGFARTEDMARHGMNVALGTDGAASNNNLDMWEEMRTASLMQKALTLNPLSIPAYTALEMATVNGAKAMGMEGELGIIKEGALADVIIVDLKGAPHLYPTQPNILSSLVYSCRASDVDTTIVNGCIKVRGHKLLDTDILSLGSRCTERLTSLTSERKS